jgi:hypothetical protein
MFVSSSISKVKRIHEITYGIVSAAESMQITAASMSVWLWMLRFEKYRRITHSVSGDIVYVFWWFDSRHYQIFREVVGLERGPLSDYNWGAIWKKSSCSGLEIREYGRRDLSRWPLGNVCPRKLALSSPTCGGRSVGIVCSGTQATDFVCLFFWRNYGDQQHLQWTR